MKIVLDGNLLESEDSFHDVIDEVARSVGFVGYGRNLDALWDVLTRMLPPPVEMHWFNTKRSREVIGQRFDQIVKVLQDAEAELGTSEFEVRLDP